MNDKPDVVVTEIKLCLYLNRIKCYQDTADTDNSTFSFIFSDPILKINVVVFYHILTQKGDLNLLAHLVHHVLTGFVHIWL